MKKNIISIAAILIALLSVSVVRAQNPKISNPDKATVKLSSHYITDVAGNTSLQICVDNCRVTGLGNASSVAASLTTVGTADVDCRNGGVDQGPVPGQSFNTTGGAVTLTAKNGVLIVSGVCVTIGGKCKNSGARWTSTISNVDLTDLYLTLNGSQVSLKDYIGQLNL